MAQQTNTERLILVTGATGNQGGVVARHLLMHGNFKVRAFVRDPNKPPAQVLQQAGAELVAGDFSDRASLDRALQGACGVFSVQTFKADCQPKSATARQLQTRRKRRTSSILFTVRWVAQNAILAFRILRASFKSKNIFDRLVCPTQFCVRFSSSIITTRCARCLRTERFPNRLVLRRNCSNCPKKIMGRWLPRCSIAPQISCTANWKSPVWR